jgi:hypothetical protein
MGKSKKDKFTVNDFEDYQKTEPKRIKEWNEFVLGFRKQRESEKK